VADLYLNPEKIVPDGVADSALKLWLPMMEGAGTTAYDGSGNGNHGTISGATWVSGIGAPVAQTALVSWNKGVNELPQSNRLAAISLNFAYQSSTGIDATITAPDGSTDSFEYICDAVTTSTQFSRINPNATYTNGQVYTYSLFVKYNTKQFVKLSYMNYATSEYFAAAFDLVNGLVTDTEVQGLPTNTSSFIEEAPNGWYRIGISAALPSSAGNAMNFEFNVLPSGTPTWSTYGRVTQTTTTSDKVYIYGASLIEGAKGVYTPTIGTAQTSPVLLPQGLTANKDITGVNAFESARNPYALNLDGKSWGEVHDNASLDITSAITLEAWINSTDKDQYHHIISKNKSANANYAMLTEITTGYLGFELLGGEFKKTDYNVMDGNWNHVVATYDETNLKFYVNGALDETIAYTSAIPTNSVDVYIGARPEGVQLYEADIALPRIYNRALTATEVARNYNADKSKFGL